MLAYCNAIWRCRYFWLALVKLDLRSRYRGSVLGLGWSLLHPIAMTIIFTCVFCRLFKQDPRQYGVYVLTGMACWSFLLNATLTGCQSFFLGEAYIRQYPAPMAIYPLRAVLATMFHFLIAISMALGLSLLLVGRCTVASLLALPAAFLLMLLLGWALALLGGLATVYFRDTRHILEVGFQVLFYMTPVFYREDLLAERSGLVALLRYNPVLPFLKLFRNALLEGEVSPAKLYAKACVIVAVAVLTATYALAKLERRLIFHL
jgi:ABC-type polysaccharide/polyol phosphate export permease